jgi:hypothetical protein
MVTFSDSNSQTIGGPFYSAHDDDGFGQEGLQIQLAWLWANHEDGHRAVRVA